MKIAVLIPCYNEGQAIFDVVRSYQQCLPSADVYVYDNNSTDNTISEAKRAGAIVGVETQQGKGNVVRRMFSDIDADIYIMVDGDGTYDAAKAPEMIKTFQENNLDMLIGTRVEVVKTAHRSGHKFGNYIFNLALKILFKSQFKDIFSGYRVFSKRFVKTFPAMTSGFDIETEISIFALNLKLAVLEIETNFYERVEGTVSKLSTFRDGFKIGVRMLHLFKEFRPLLLFFCISAFFLLTGIVLGVDLVNTFKATGTVPKIPTAIICTGLGILSVLSISIGLVLDSISNQRRELMRILLLQYK